MSKSDRAVLDARTRASKDGAPSLLQDPTLYIGLFFLVMILGQAAFYAVAFQLPSDALPVGAGESAGERAGEHHGSH